jgi:hypothetical protein
MTMIRLEFTLAETHLLQQWLLDTLPAQREELRTVLTKLATAADQATRQLHCPVCQHAFTQETVGRTGHYCSPACKQKAYRQRRLAARKQFGPPKKR